MTQNLREQELLTERLKQIKKAAPAVRFSPVKRPRVKLEHSEMAAKEAARDAKAVTQEAGVSNWMWSAGGELPGLNMRSIQTREEHWVVADLQGKAGHIRTIPIPTWVKDAISNWMSASGIADGCLFRAINKAGRFGEAA